MESVSSEYQEHLQPSKILRRKLPINWSCDQNTQPVNKTPNSKKKRTKPNPSPTLICTTCLHLFLNFLSQKLLSTAAPSLVVVGEFLPSSWILIGCVVGGWKKNNGGNCWPLKKIMGSVLTTWSFLTAWSFLTTWLIFDQKYNHVHYLSIRQKDLHRAKAVCSRISLQG